MRLPIDYSPAPNYSDNETIFIIFGSPNDFEAYQWFTSCDNVVENDITNRSIGDDISQLVININELLPISSYSVIHSIINLTFLYAVLTYYIILSLCMLVLSPVFIVSFLYVFECMCCDMSKLN